MLKEYSQVVNIKIPTEGARHLGAVLGDINFKEEISEK